MKKPKIPAYVKKLLKGKKIIKLDVGCGDRKQRNFIGMDIRKTKNSDVVHDCEKLPYPFPSEAFDVVLTSHLVEHLKPWLIIDIMNEWWRITKPGGQLWLGTPYAGSFGFWQDPTHVKGWNEATPTYFDPRHFLYNIYKPKPWFIIRNDWFQTSNQEIVFEKLDIDHGIKTPGEYDNFPDQEKKQKAIGNKAKVKK